MTFLEHAVAHCAFNEWKQRVSFYMEAVFAYVISHFQTLFLWIYVTLEYKCSVDGMIARSLGKTEDKQR